MAPGLESSTGCAGELALDCGPRSVKQGSGRSSALCGRIIVSSTRPHLIVEMLVEEMNRHTEFRILLGA